ncbi:MAG: membrane dipeptidase [Firmicutes bacterium]|nr:membrane dipeptidase [Bacillota bacterium]
MIVDLHNDILTGYISNRQLERYLLESEARLVNYAIWTTRLHKPMQFIKTHVGILRAVKRRRSKAFSKGENGSVVGLGSKGDSACDSSGGCKGFLWSVEDLGFLASSVAKIKCIAKREAELDRMLTSLISLKPFCVSLTWNNQNLLAGGADSVGGLSEIGKQIVRVFQHHNVYIDTAHLNEQSFYDVCRVSEKRLVNTHTAFYDVNPHMRNLKKRQLKTLVENDGLVALTLVPQFLSGSGECVSIDHVIKHIDYFAQCFGVDNLCIGTDFFGTDALPKGLEDYPDFKRLKDKLLGRGYKESEIYKIFVGNAQAFIR